MNEDFSQPGQGSWVLTQVHEGMKVYDSENKHIGTVDRVYFGEVSEEEAELGTGAATPKSPPLPGEGSFVEEIAEAFAGDDDDMEEEVRERLLREGFIEVDVSGIFDTDRYALPEHVASVSGDRVFLKVTADDLIKR
jgi:hypothetical protein